MLSRRAAETTFVVYRSLVLVSWIACALIALSFVMFARDQVSGASKGQVSQLTATAPPAPAPPGRHRPGQPRRFIDSAARDLLSPFKNAVPSSSDWVRHGIPTLLGLLVYGAGIGFLARFTRGLA